MKNLSHIRFGRMHRRQEEARHMMSVDALSRLDRHPGDSWSMTPTLKERDLRGADEPELVRSGPDDTLTIACHSMREVWHIRDDITDLRIAAFVVAFGRVALTSAETGL